MVPVSALYVTHQEKVVGGTFETGMYFLDWLKKTHQSAWQFLPLHETQLEPGSGTKHVSSPYKTYGVGLDTRYLPKSFSQKIPTTQELAAFTDLHSDWILDYALFCAIRDYAGTDDWRVWDPKLRGRDEKALLLWTEKLKNEINRHIILQWQTHEAFGALRKKAGKLGISLIGDLPFYLSVQSPLVWVYQDIFQIGDNGVMRYVSGIPQTPSAHFGRQVWGHPLYDWNKKGNLEKIVAFWKMRLRYQPTLYDFVRLDHAKAFFDYGVIDLSEKDHDIYQKGPGMKVFEELVTYGYKNGLSMFVEDSGENLQELRKSSKKLKIPGIKIFRFAIDEKKGKINKEYIEIEKYPGDTVAYTTTHDTEPLIVYLEKLTSHQRQAVIDSTGLKPPESIEEFAVALRDAIIASPARMVIIPIQDWLLMRERINVPGTEIPVGDPNWQFRLSTPIDQLPEEI